MGVSKIAKLQAGLARQRQEAAPRLIPTPVHDRHHGRYALPGAFMIERRYLMPDPDQPRKHFAEEKLRELADSIREHGILQPLRVRPADEEGYYFIVAGARRWHASAEADVNELPVIVRDSPIDRRFFEQLVENLQREDLSDEEEANAYRTLHDQGYGISEIARRLGVDKAVISRKVRVYREDDLAGAIDQHTVTAGQAQELLPVKSVDEREQILREVAARRAAGHEVRNDDIRRLARDAPSFERRSRRRESAGVMGHNERDEVVGVVAHNTTVLAPLSDNPRLNIDKAVKNVIDKLYGLPGHYPEVAMSREVSAALDEALRAVQEWRSRNGVVR